MSKEMEANRGIVAVVDRPRRHHRVFLLHRRPWTISKSVPRSTAPRITSLRAVCDAAWRVLFANATTIQLCSRWFSPRRCRTRATRTLTYASCLTGALAFPWVSCSMCAARVSRSTPGEEVLIARGCLPSPGNFPLEVADTKLSELRLQQAPVKADRYDPLVTVSACFTRAAGRSQFSG